MADQYPKPTGNFIQERNSSSQSELGDLMRRIVDTRWYDAMVIEENVDNTANRYRVNVHAGGIWAQETHKDIIAVVPEAQRFLPKGTYCKVVLDGKIAIVMPWYGPFRVILDGATTQAGILATPRRLQGWLGDPVKGISSQYRTADYRVSLSYGLTVLKANPARAFLGTGTGMTFKDANISYNDDSLLVGFAWASPTIVKDIDKDGHETPYVSIGYVIPEGGKLPVATAKYQVLTILDDQLTPVWDYERFT